MQIHIFCVHILHSTTDLYIILYTVEKKHDMKHVQS